MLDFLREENVLTGRLLPPNPTSETQQLQADIDLFSFRQIIFRCMLGRRDGKRLSDVTFRQEANKVSFSDSAEQGAQIVKKFLAQWELEVETSKTPTLKHISLKDTSKAATWYNVRGCLGESVLHWLMHLKTRAVMSQESLDSYDELLTPRATKGHHSGQDVGVYVMVILKGLMELPEGRSLMTEAYSEEPFKGQTILHMACAEGDEDIVKAILAEGKKLEHATFHQFLNYRLTGEFLQTVVKRPQNIEELECMITPSSLGHQANEHVPGLTAIEITIIAMTEQHVEHNLSEGGKDPQEALLEQQMVVISRLLHLLSEAGAHIVIGEDDDKGEKRTLYTLLHLVARCRWQGPGPYQMTEKKTVAILKMLTDRANKFDVLHRREKNARGFTALQCAAMVGNQTFYTAMLDNVKVTVTRWGNTHEYAFPLAEIDSGADADSLCALELMTLYKRSNLLSLGLSQSLILEKWALFGRTWMVVMLGVQLSAAILTAVVCLDSSVGYSPIRWWSRVAVLSIASLYTIVKLLLFWFCARDERWFQHMNFFSSNNRIGKFDILSFRSSLEMITMAIIVLTVPWYHRDWLSVNTYNITWHFVASIWWFIFCWHLIRFFELFEKTGPLASALPEIMQSDIIPFMSLYSVFFFGSAIALRIATTTTTSDRHDSVVGTFKDTTATLEEAIHGPDVQWRTIVYNHSPIAAFVFIAFLWITLVMMTILIALFSDRYAQLQAHTKERFLFRRAMFVLTMEKIMPTFYHEWMQFDIGSKRGGLWSLSRSDQRVIDSYYDPEKQESAANTSPSEKSPLISDRLNFRWYLWRGGKSTLHRWKQNVMTDTTYHL